MVDFITLGLALLIILAVFLRKTSAGVAILALMAGVLLDQLLASWLIELLPNQTVKAIYLEASVHLVLTFAPMVASLIAVKINKQNTALSLLSSVVLSVLVLFFGVKILNNLPVSTLGERTSGFLEFILPYQNVLLAGAAILATIEMIFSHSENKGFSRKKK